MKGSVTIEAAWIFPFCFFVIAIVSCLGIYEYNQTVLKISGYECIVRTMEERDLEEALFREHLKGRILETATERTLGIDDLQTSIIMTVNKIVVNIKGTQRLLHLPLEVEVFYERAYPEKTLQLLRE